MHTNYLNAANKGGVYEIRNNISGHFYIGSTKCFKRRFRQHVHSLQKAKQSPYLQKAWEKYGDEAFSFNVLLVLEKEELQQRFFCEQKLINQYWNMGVLYNTTPVVDHATVDCKPKDVLKKIYSREKSECERQKISQALSGRKHYKERTWSITVQNVVSAFRNDSTPQPIVALSPPEVAQCREAYDKWTRGGTDGINQARRKQLFKTWLIEHGWFFDKRRDSWLRKKEEDKLAAIAILEKYRILLNKGERKAVERA